MTLPNDYSRCANTSCQLREQCARFTERRPVSLMTRYEPNEDGTCDDFITNKPDHEPAQ
jgi:hypothetical protein